jgi:glyoxylase-like metal-dependent hydrolase (beta-lactamase superfamily II)
MSFHISNMVFCGDALFVEDAGTGRCDFPNGSAEELYHSVHENLYSLPDNTIVFVGHDYQPNGRELKFETTIGASKRNNCHLKRETTKDEYVSFREARDKTLKAPKLLIPSIRANINAGIIPETKN